MRKIYFVLLAAIALAGCGGDYYITRTDKVPPEQIRTAAIAPSEGNSGEVTTYLSDALQAAGIGVVQPLPRGTTKSSHVDAVVTYADVWRWDMVTYMQSISINLYNARSGELLASGRWRDSKLHSFNRGEAVSKQLIWDMLQKLREESKSLYSADASNRNTVGTARNETGTNTQIEPQPIPPTGSSNRSQQNVSKFDYSARQKAREMNCDVQGSPSTQALIDGRQVLSLSCKDGRQLMLSCATGSECKAQ
jgi:hypothetical protein